MYVYSQIVMIALVNICLFYRRDCGLLNIPPKRWMKHPIIQAELSTALIGYQVADEGDEKPPHMVNNKRRRAQPDDAG